MKIIPIIVATQILIGAIEAKRGYQEAKVTSTS